MFSCCCFYPYTVLHQIVFILALSLYPIAHSSPESYCIYSKINMQQVVHSVISLDHRVRCNVGRPESRRTSIGAKPDGGKM